MADIAATRPRPGFKFARNSGNAGVYLAFVVLLIGLAFAAPRFFTFGNLTDVLRQAVPIAVIAFGATFVIGMRGIDLSVGSTLALSGLVTANLIVLGYPVALACAGGIAVGAIIGFVNGILITKVGITDFIATMAIMVISRGIVMVYTQGIPIVGASDPSFRMIGQSYVGGIPVPVILTAIVFAIAFYMLYYTRFGRFVLSIGSNPDAARLVGIPTDKVKIGVYVLVGILSAFAGVLLTSRLEAAMPEAGTGYELDVIAAVVIGGTGLSGGRATLFGTVIGAVLMAVVRNALNLLNVNTFWHQVVIGTIILIAVAADRFNRRQKA
ncbi:MULTISPECIES: ABC transporter permease [Rhizobium/Agrobacterium group]|uniref:ABC transporter permease n=1 Tax=Rhizobium/Agrobacterium group TaxID=227290 RepID=UPI00107FBD6E|nr:MULTISPECIES: ribose ABC transporter permease [Rhizobium/Agrobacterium group]MBB4402768.1 ribose transport system permease protein [Agrobacterium radiobacter]MBB5589321.1 ribose transport system permease protein [Agrobacterium radiobacter]TGE85856.1 ribose ABC transporter permease [Rhizobium sp. SEMIA 4032]